MTPTEPRPFRRLAAQSAPFVAPIVLFIVLAVASNWVTAKWGQVYVGPLLVTAGTFTAGLAFLVRDWVHEKAGVWAVVGCIVAGSVLSAWTSSPRLALASGAAFLLSEAADLAVYSWQRRRSTWRAVLASNIVGAIADSVLFLTLAGFGLTWASTSGQVVVKVAVTVPAVIVLVVWRVVLRDRVRPESA